MHIKLLAPAKINFFLEILGKRKNGYHEILSVMQTISLYDEIEIKKKRSGISVKCNIKELENEKNLAFLAADRLRKHLNEKSGCEIYIKKNIPIAAGLGGGSSDAATVLLGLLKLWSKKNTVSELIRIAKDIGADVPFFLYGGCCIVKGIGDIIQPIKPFWYDKPLKICLLIGQPIETKIVYNHYDKFKHKPKSIRNITVDFSAQTKNFWEKLLFNRLEEAVFKLVPKLSELKESILSLGIKNVLMSGSGSAIFVIPKSEEEIKKIKKHYTAVICAETVFPKSPIFGKINIDHKYSGVV